jgi:hypothetical protein
MFEYRVAQLKYPSGKSFYVILTVLFGETGGEEGREAPREERRAELGSDELFKCEA